MDADRLHDDALRSWRIGEVTAAASLLRQALALAPDVAAYHANLAVILKDIGTFEERFACYRRAIELDPANAAYRANLAAALNAAGSYDKAAVAATEAVTLDPQRTESWHNLGSALAGQRRWLEASQAFERALALGLTAPPTRLAAAAARLECKDFAAAAGHYRELMASGALTGVGRVAAHLGLARAVIALGAGREALTALETARDLDPANPAVLVDLGNLYKRLFRYDAACACYRRVLELAPACVEANFNLGAVDQACARYDAALARYRQVLHVAPTLTAGWQNLAASLTYRAATPPGEVAAALAEFDRLVARPLRPAQLPAWDRDPGRRLRIAYVSADFRAHPVGYLTLPLIEGHDRERFHITCYVSHRQKDEWTAKFEAVADEWVEVAGLDDEALAKRIRADGIDLLVDLAGHSEGNRLLTFARKPAPVQVTWIGYVTTTGMSAMDWRLTHAVADPVGAEDAYSERLWRLPGTIWCFRPLPGMPEVSPPPYARTGHVTFGSLNRYSKNSPETLAAWAEILRRVPDADILICVPRELQSGLRAFFAEQGVPPTRIRCFEHGGHADFWRLHAEVDVALDPFPFNGGMTSCETLWLGVPLVSCCGMDAPAGEESFPARFASRMGRTLLDAVGLPDLAAPTVTGYVDRAVALAQDGKRLAELRNTLRGLMAASPLMDERRFVADVEAAYQEMWRIAGTADDA